MKKNSRDNILKIVSDYALQEDVSIKEAKVVADFCGELLKFETDESEARFRLDGDSICYGCTCYKNVDDVNDPNNVSEDDVLCGGICDCAYPCIKGSMNE